MRDQERRRFTVGRQRKQSRVEIAAVVDSGKEVEGKKGTGLTKLESLIPEEYNTNSTLTAKVSADEPNELEFELKSAP